MPDYRTEQQIHRAAQGARVPGWAGIPDGLGGFSTTVPGGQGLIYVRVGAKKAASHSLAYDLVGLTFTADDDAPLWLERDRVGMYTIVARRYIG